MKYSLGWRGISRKKDPLNNSSYKSKIILTRFKVGHLLSQVSWKGKIQTFCSSAPDCMFCHINKMNRTGIPLQVIDSIIPIGANQKVKAGSYAAECFLVP